MTYEELGVYGRLRKVVRCGPVATFRHCCQLWREKYTPQQVADKVREDAIFGDLLANIAVQQASLVGQEGRVFNEVLLLTCNGCMRQHDCCVCCFVALALP